MRASKVKNLALIILALLNVVLLCLVIPMRLEQHRQDQRTAKELERLFAQAEVQLPGELPESQPLHALEATLDTDAAQTAAQAILGGDAEAERESYFLSYRSEAGSCQIRRSHLQAELAGRTLSGSKKTAVRRLYEQMGLSGSVVAEQENGVTVRQSILGVDVFSAQLSFTFDGEQLTAVRGTFCPVEGTLTALGKETGIGCADALVAFLNARGETGWVGARVISAKQGYVLADSASAAKLRLNPVWRLETDTGVYYVNALTGEVFQD